MSIYSQQLQDYLVQALLKEFTAGNLKILGITLFSSLGNFILFSSVSTIIFAIWTKIDCGWKFEDSIDWIVPLVISAMVTLCLAAVYSVLMCCIEIKYTPSKSEIYNLVSDFEVQEQTTHTSIPKLDREAASYLSTYNLKGKPITVKSTSGGYKYELGFYSNAENTELTLEKDDAEDFFRDSKSFFVTGTLNFNNAPLKYKPINEDIKSICVQAIQDYLKELTEKESYDKIEYSTDSDAIPFTYMETLYPESNINPALASTGALGIRLKDGTHFIIPSNATFIQAKTCEIQVVYKLKYSSDNSEFKSKSVDGFLNFYYEPSETIIYYQPFELPTAPTNVDVDVDVKIR